MFGIGGFELFLILLFGFLIFGPDKLPAMAKTLGKAISKFRSAQDEMNKVIKTEVYDPNSDEPFKNPLDALSKVGESAKKLDEDGKAETFSERKARYDKERAEKKAASEKVAAGTAAVSAAATAKTEKASDGTEATKDAVEKKPTADELYGTTSTKSVSKTETAPAEKTKPSTTTTVAKKTAAPKSTTAKKTAAPKSTTAKKTAAPKSTTAKKVSPKKPSSEDASGTSSDASTGSTTGKGE